MIRVHLPDGSSRELEAGASAADLAAQIGPGLAKAAVAAVVNGAIRDLSLPLEDGADIRLLTKRDSEALEVLRHSAAHLMADAILRVFPKARVVHVVRNGVDVALDLAQREQERRAQLKSRARSSRCLDPARAFEVWSSYVSAAVASTEHLPADRVLRLRYEELSAQPKATFEDLLHLAQVELEEEQQAEVLGALDPLGVETFQESAEGRALYRELSGHALMEAFEYDGVKAAS